MKQVANLDGGSVVVNEAAGVFTISLDGSKSLGGGQAAGVVAVSGQGSIVLNAEQAEKLAAALIIAKSPPALQLVEEAAQAVEESLVSSL